MIYSKIIVNFDDYIKKHYTVKQKKRKESIFPSSYWISHAIQQVLFLHVLLINKPCG